MAKQATKKEIAIMTFHMNVLDYLTMASDPSFESIQKIYKRALELGEEQWAYDTINPESGYGAKRGLQGDLKHFELI